MKWDKRFLLLAEHVAAWSKDPSTKVGCVLVDDQRRVIGMGYNGFPRGVDDNAARYEDRATKYMMVQHAEANAVLNSTRDVRGATAYITHHPCTNCAGLLIQSGVSRIVSFAPSGGLAERFADSFRIATIMLDEAGVSVELN